MYEDVYDVVEEQIKEADRLPEVGVVTSVRARESADMASNHEVNVLLRDEDHERRDVGIATNYNGHIRIPEEGDVVLVGFLDGVGEKPFLQDIIYTNKQRAPLGKEGDWRLRVSDDLYLEASPDDGFVRLAHKSGGDLDEPDTVVEVDDSDGNPSVDIESANGVDVQASGDVTIKAAGDAHLDAEGDVFIGDEDNSQRLAPLDHTHDYDDDGNTKTTDTPNEDGTRTQVE